MSTRTYSAGSGAYTSPYPWTFEPLYAHLGINYFDGNDDTAGAADWVPSGSGYGDDDVGGEVTFTDDGAIPVLSTINSVTQRIKIGTATFVKWYSWPYQRRPGIGQVNGAQLIYTKPAAYISVVWTSDVQGAAFTKSVIFQTRFGVGNDHYLTNSPQAHVAVSEMRLEIDFDLPAPLVTTEEARNLAATTATLVGTLNPQGANATYPVSYYFEYSQSPTLASSSTTTPVGGQTGSSAVEVTEDITGLIGGTWYYRLVATNADQTVYGDIESFTLSVSADAFVLDEFLIATSSPGFAAKDARLLLSELEFAVQAPFPCNREEILEDVE